MSVVNRGGLKIELNYYDIVKFNHISNLVF
jgi:hypothetical protein